MATAIQNIRALSAALQAKGFVVRSDTPDYKLKPIHARYNAAVLLQHPKTQMLCSLNAQRACLYTEVGRRIAVLVQSPIHSHSQILDKVG